ncbi:MAG: DUF5398 domain-containing protein [Simkaniaceae bacterium]|nr:DUF5398 domain-containing protein [Simkaniaceae bacterium]
MFGLEKKKKKPFEFDLEKELRKDPKKRAKMIEDIARHKHELKAILREGTKTKEFEQCSLLLQGYEALETVINNVDKD